MIQFTNAGHTFKNGTVGLADINLKIDAGEFVYIVGESGAGKSTFAKLVLRELVAFFENIAKLFALFNGHCPNQNRLSFLI